MSKYIPLILIGVMLTAFAQIFLKKGMMSLGHFDFAWSNALSVVMAAALNPAIILGVSCQAISLVVWMLVLSRVEVSFAYPFTSLGYVVVAAIGYWTFQEQLNGYRISGIALICLGVFLVSRSGEIIG